MTAEITIPVSFYKLSAFPAIKNCERGYYQFDGEPEGEINE
jgi:hypothetical protein